MFEVTDMQSESQAQCNTFNFPKSQVVACHYALNSSNDYQMFMYIHQMYQLIKLNDKG